MSVLKVSAIKNNSSSSNNLVLNTDGSLTLGTGGELVANTYAASTFTSNNYVQTQLGTKLNSSSYTASDVLTKIKTVDGSGSGLDADLLDGINASGFVSNNFFQDNQPSSFGVVSATVVNGSASGTYTVPAGINYIAGVVVGGGGGGGANERNSPSNPGGGDGGGGGICGFGFGVTPGATYSYSIGAGGNRGTWNNNFFTNAGAGGTSNFHGNTFRGNGGSAGYNSPSGGAAAGGNATGGIYNVTGTVGTTVHEGRIHKGLVAGVLGALGGTTVDKDGTILSNASTIGSATVGQGGQGSIGGYNEDGYAGSAGSLIVYEFS